MGKAKVSHFRSLLIPSALIGFAAVCHCPNANADPAIPPERRKAGDITHSVALINACKPWHWREQFPATNAPSPEVARKAREKFGWLLNGGDGA